jgi:hypothetical protein
MVSRSIYNLNIDTTYTYDIPFDRSFLQLSNRIRHVMPSTDPKPELTAKALMAQPVSQPAVYANVLIKWWFKNILVLLSMFVWYHLVWVYNDKLTNFIVCGLYVVLNLLRNYIFSVKKYKYWKKIPFSFKSTSEILTLFAYWSEHKLFLSWKLYLMISVNWCNLFGSRKVRCSIMCFSLTSKLTFLTNINFS